MNKTLFLVRHCAAGGPQPDTHLTDVGHEQAILLAEWLSQFPIERIVASPYPRARQTVEPLAQRLQLPVDIDERLAERTLCETPRDDWRERIKASFLDLDICLPGGESSRVAQARGIAAIEDALSRPEQTTVLVSHGQLLTLLLNHFDESVGYHEYQQLTNPDVFRVTCGDGKAQVQRLRSP
jgi:2,3-bisphosphoglycerate-dependent phosphoglycerate mutase